MANLTDAQVYALAAARWPQVAGSADKSPATIATAISFAENRTCDPTATNRNTNGSIDRGLWQINSVHRQFDPARLLADPGYNADCALALWKARGRTFRDWSTYNSGAYLAQMGRALRARSLATGGNGQTGGPGVIDVLTGTATAAAGAVADLNPIGTVLDLADRVLDLGFWKRAGVMAVGWWLVLGGTVLLFRDTLTTTATAAAGVAAPGSTAAAAAAAKLAEPPDGPAAQE